jgi:DNA-binding NtrC family response regulator
VLFPVLRAPRREGEGAAAPESLPGALKDVRVLVVEDDFIVGFDMQMLLEEQGARVLGPAASLAEARSLLAQNSPQVAVLDVNLSGELVFPLVEELQKRDIPYVFATAYADDDRLFPESTRQAPRLAKPVLPNVLIGQIAKVLR